MKAQHLIKSQRHETKLIDFKREEAFDSIASPNVEFKKIMLPDGKILKYKTMQANATAVFCDFDLTIANSQLHSNLFQIIYGQAYAFKYDLETSGKYTAEQVDREINKLFHAKYKELSKDEKFLSEQIQCIGVRGGSGKCKAAIENLQKKGIIFTISTFSDYPVAIKLFLEKNVGLHADFLICDLKPKFSGETDHPKFMVFQDYTAPKENLIIIICGTPKNANDKKTTKMSSGHYDMGVALLRFLGLKVKPCNTVVVDDTKRHLTAASKGRSIAQVFANLGDKKAAFWDNMVEVASKLHATYLDGSHKDPRDQDSLGLTEKYVELMKEHVGTGLQEFPRGLVNIHCNFSHLRQIVSESTGVHPSFTYKMRLEFSDIIEAKKFCHDCTLYLKKFIILNNQSIYIREGRELNIMAELSNSLKNHPKELIVRPLITYIEMQIGEVNESSRGCGGINRLFGGFSKSENISAAFTKLLNLANG